MNGYAIQLGFTGKRSEDLNEAFRYLDSPVLKVGGAPHLSLAVFEKNESKSYIEAAISFAASTSLEKISIDGVDSFPGDAHIAFLKVTLDTLLQKEHQRFHSELANNEIESLPYYRPGQWTPHITVTMEDEELKKRVLEQADTLDLCGDIEIGSIRVIKFKPVEVLAIIPLQNKTTILTAEAAPHP